MVNDEAIIEIVKYAGDSVKGDLRGTLFKTRGRTFLSTVGDDAGAEGTAVAEEDEGPAPLDEG